MPRFRSGWLIAVVGVCALLGAGAAFAQQNSILERLNARTPGGEEDVENPVAVSARFTAAAGSRTGELEITVEVAAGFHIYSITQPKGGPNASKITLEKSDDYELTGEFKPSCEPKTHVDDQAFKGVPLEEHEGRITWTVLIKLAEGVDPSKLAIGGKFFYQACNAGGCRFPTNLPFKARLSATDRPVAAGEPGEYTKDKQVKFHGHLEPKTARPGDKVKLLFRAEPAVGWHLYQLMETVPHTINKPTLIVFDEAQGVTVGRREASVRAKEGAEGGLAQYRGRVDFTVELSVDETAQPGEKKIAGILAYQTCTERNCAPPTAVGFEVSLHVADAAVPAKAPVTFTGKQAYNKAAELTRATAAFDLSQVQVADGGAANEPLWQMMFFGFLGGAILNLMPCVLPVIGLKILSFVEQSHHSRRQSFLLNVWYSLGMLAVFMVLATLPVAARLFWGTHFGWGQQFAFDGFNITLTAIVFVMALSFLGVWEIPIPGFVGSGTANELAAKEGIAGAFCKGAITTVLATPCSGPFLGTALAFAVAQPAQITYTMFAAIGLGMASPYLLIGAFPKLIRFLPKPGAWMDTFKQTMGFVLLGTVVYLMTLIEWQRFVPTLALLMGLWAACWWIGRVPLYAEFSAKARAWAGAASFSVLIGLFAFQWLEGVMDSRFDAAIAARLNNRNRTAQAHGEHELPWEPFSAAKLSQYVGQGKTVMVDFTADWCWTCKTLEATVLNTSGTEEYVRAHNVVPMVADMTRYPPEESELLRKLTGPGGMVPVLAIFPAARPIPPIVLKDAYTQGYLLEKLREATSTKAVDEKDNATAMKVGK